MGKTIIFDVDGTLLNTEIIYMRAWVEAGASFGYVIPDIALKQTRAVSAPVAAACFRQHCGEEFPYETILKERMQISEQIIEATKPQALLMPHARMTLQRLKEQGYTIAAASSTGYAKTCAHLKQAGLFDYFSTVVCGDMVARGKPQPDIFLKAAELCGVRPEQCLVVGDTPADVLGGTAAGMKVILIPDQVPANAQTTALSWKTLSGLHQLPEALDEVDK